MFSALATMPSTEMALPRAFPLFLLPKHISTTRPKKASATWKASTSSVDSDVTSSSSSSEVESPPSSSAVTGTFSEREVVLTEDELHNPPAALTNDLIAASHIESSASPSSAATSACFCREVILTEEDLKQPPSPPKSPRFQNTLSRFTRRRRFSFEAPTPVDPSTLVRDVPLVVEHVGAPFFVKGPAPVVPAAARRSRRSSLFTTSAAKSDVVCEGW